MITDRVVSLGHFFVFVVLAAMCLAIPLTTGSLNAIAQTNRVAICVVRSVCAQETRAFCSNSRAESCLAETSDLRQVRFLAIARAWRQSSTNTEWLSDQVLRSSSLRDEVTRVAIANAYLARGYEDAAMELFQTVPATWQMMYKRGQAHMCKQRLEEALVWFNRAMSIDPVVSVEKLGLYRDTCNLRKHFSETEGALDACRLFLQVAPPGSGAHTLMGEVYIQARDCGAAQQILTAGLYQEPPSSRHYTLLGQAYYGQGDVASARIWYEKALALDPGNVVAHLHMGILLMGEGSRQQARVHLEQTSQSPISYYRDWANRLIQQIDQLP